ncbi:MAG TPA: hypothetical protein VGO59_13950 [Verrucomicrobiae bacterium]|jgi:hypothetical protein
MNFKSAASMLVFALTAAWASASAPCRIEIVDKSCGWPVPMVELQTLHDVRFVTDNAGVIAFDLPELMGRETWFEIKGDGYAVKKDGFGYAGFRFTPEPGQTHRVEVERTIIARRVGRVTGGGLFGESQKLGAEASWQESGVLGQDSIQNATYQGKLFWLWGDTTLPRYPLGVFDSTCATTAPQPLTSLEPPLRMPLAYFRDKQGIPKGVAKMAGQGPTWISAMTTVPDAQGREHLVATYVKIHNPLHIYRQGLAVWDDAAESFKSLRVLWEESAGSERPPPAPDGHSVKWTDDAGKAWMLFCTPFPTMRCPAAFEAWSDSNSWERLTPPRNLLAAQTGDKVRPHGGSIAWNAWRKRWVAVFVQAGGEPSPLGEVWYAEARSPLGPWGPAVKVLTHENYSFYNPQLHPEFTPENSPILFFEGTHSGDFARNPVLTPRYDYNQLLYRLDLDDPRLSPARQE